MRLGAEREAEWVTRGTEAKSGPQGGEPYNAKNGADNSAERKISHAMRGGMYMSIGTKHDAGKMATREGEARSGPRRRGSHKKGGGSATTDCLANCLVVSMPLLATPAGFENRGQAEATKGLGAQRSFVLARRARESTPPHLGRVRGRAWLNEIRGRTRECELVEGSSGLLGSGSAMWQARGTLMLVVLDDRSAA